MPPDIPPSSQRFTAPEFGARKMYLKRWNLKLSMELYPSQVRPLAERNPRRSLSYFRLARNVSGTELASSDWLIGIKPLSL
jgi:hypothetical protein